MTNRSHSHIHAEKKIPLRTRFFHAILTGVRIMAVITAVHFAACYLEHCGFFIRMGKTGDFVLGSIMDWLMFGLGEGSGK